MPTKKTRRRRILVDKACRREAGEEPVHGGFAKAGQTHDVGHAQAFRRCRRQSIEHGRRTRNAFDAGPSAAALAPAFRVMAFAGFSLSCVTSRAMAATRIVDTSATLVDSNET